jgi:hypothetical protein
VSQRTLRDTLDLNGWWHAWFDRAAPWPEDEPPPHLPRCGWAGLDEGKESLPVPGTWHASAPGYRGVAWHWRPLIIPPEWRGRRVWLRLAAVRQRAEVFLDQRLVGVEPDGLTPLTFDLTALARPGQRQELAVRVTHPGGVAGEPFAADDCGGIWGDVALIASGPTCVQGVEAWPAEDLRGVTLRLRLAHHGAAAGVTVRAVVREAEGAVVATAQQVGVELGSPGLATIEMPLALPAPRLWETERPHLYRAEVEIEDAAGHDALATTFGLRHLAQCGGMFTLNGAPLRPAPAHLWHPAHPAFPRPRLAEQVVRAARAEGYNALWLPLHLAGETLLAAADRAGVLILPPPHAPALAAARQRRLAGLLCCHPSAGQTHLWAETALTPAPLPIWERGRGPGERVRAMYQGICLTSQRRRDCPQ